MFYLFIYIYRCAHPSAVKSCLLSPTVLYTKILTLQQRAKYNIVSKVLPKIITFHSNFVVAQEHFLNFFNALIVINNKYTVQDCIEKHLVLC